MALWWIDVARDNLIKASDNYASIQRQLDRYNKVFETYANASPETQMRAASVMRQALDEYNGLKKQQQENTIKIYEAQQWVNYYNKQAESPTVVPQLHTISYNYPQEDLIVGNTMSQAPVEETSIISTATPWTLNNNLPAGNTQTDALNTNTTMNVPTNPTFTNLNNQNKVNPTPVLTQSEIPFGPQYSNTTIGPRTTSTNAFSNINYWAWSMAWMNNVYNSWLTNWIKRNNSSLPNKIANWINRWLTYLYNRLK